MLTVISYFLIVWHFTRDTGKLERNFLLYTMHDLSQNRHRTTTRSTNPDKNSNKASGRISTMNIAKLILIRV